MPPLDGKQRLKLFPSCLRGIAHRDILRIRADRHTSRDANRHARLTQRDRSKIALPGATLYDSTESSRRLVRLECFVRNREARSEKSFASALERRSYMQNARLG